MGCSVRGRVALLRQGKLRQEVRAMRLQFVASPGGTGKIWVWEMRMALHRHQHARPQRALVLGWRKLPALPSRIKSRHDVPGIEPWPSEWWARGSKGRLCHPPPARQQRGRRAKAYWWRGPAGANHGSGKQLEHPMSVTASGRHVAGSWPRTRTTLISIFHAFPASPPATAAASPAASTSVIPINVGTGVHFP